ncbi:magnesium/cobalt transporter CorA [Blochmannia endosymbiont of Colobopsis nipponica]|uniref:magnesium/cobalt transporter CorA n=1 Tax=Blochmannia endosymbiont of Colobopsis nipponica TaxID=2681987 RepID=UPI00177E938E|nr:magnesium/cobalt transporter CorA [Blochmannia endosymbiont of Colobopsis nipponica]QOI10887.1 magnesium/cobalt transporter CorA [Blochmannia endosymbiont of Colobopsis nipponica]QOI10897.1 magnesium/cobalt transporter CorA [Blochmannia endosymbiont of Colobopsis nipponica]
MLSAFKLENNQLVKINLEKSFALREAIWIDLIEPTKDEFNRIQIELGDSFIKCFDSKGNIGNSKFLKSKKDLYICSVFFYNEIYHQTDGIVVSFIICDGKLYSVREQEISVFRFYQTDVDNTELFIDDNGAYTILLDLFELKIDHLANKIENVYSDLEVLGVLIMNGKEIDKYSSIFSTLASLEQVCWKLRRCLLDTQRSVDFLIRKAKISINQISQAKKVLSIIDYLLVHTETVLQKVNFLIQIAMGFINIEQNRVLRFFSVVFLPPTLVASSYGMNFEFMPELKWSFGYPIAIILMILTGLAPYLYFKHKNWL